MKLQDAQKRLQDFTDRAFVAREVFFRSTDRFHHLRLSVRVQKLAALGVALSLAWGVFATGSFVVDRFMIAAQKRAAEAQRGAYVELLADVDNYFNEFARITQDLQDDQIDLVALLEEETAKARDTVGLRDLPLRAEQDPMGSGPARDAVRIQMTQLGETLQGIADRNSTLHAQVGRMRRMVQEAKSVRSDFAATRSQLIQRLAESEEDLTRSLEARRELRTLAESLRAELERAEDIKSNVLRDKADMMQQIAELQRQAELVSAIQSQLERRVAVREEARQAAEARAESLRVERDLLARRVDGLEQHLADLRDAGQSVIERFSERTRLTIDEIEKTVLMTGLDVEALVASAASQEMGQGGPFVPDDAALAGFDPGLGLEASVTSLEEQLNRWQALKEILRSMPLTAPLDQFRISSGFGSRKDPVNGRKAKHLGVDFSAPSRSAAYATAPGKVVFAGWRGRFGRLVEIDHGHGIRTRYAHLQKVLVKVGQEVGHREKIGLVGSSGRSTGPHVHYEIRYRGQAQNPMKFLKAGNYVFKG